ncbi:MAG: RNA polymerase sigma factor [Planctomycetes bacterium]|nr:RNA polymerase sigma factor [Planctomycetota bacterium]
MTEDTETDPGRALMLRVKQGDHEAFERLVERFQDVVLNLVFKFSGTRREAEDLSQDVFLRIFRARETYEPDARFTTWLYKIVFNLCVNRAAREKLRRTESLESWDETSPSNANGRAHPSERTPLEQLQRGELALVVRNAVARLPENQRMALVLFKYEELSQREIAEVMGSTEKAIKSLLSRARESLRASLQPFLERGTS